MIRLSTTYQNKINVLNYNYLNKKCKFGAYPSHYLVLRLDPDLLHHENFKKSDIAGLPKRTALSFLSSKLFQYIFSNTFIYETTIKYYLICYQYIMVL